MAELGYLNIFAEDIAKLAGFYADLFGLEELVASRSPIFRGLRTNKANIGFNAHDAYELLNLPKSTDGTGIKAFMTFDVDSVEEVDRLTPIAVEKGATLLKAPVTTYYGWYQSVLLDPEGNAFRINCAAGTSVANTPAEILTFWREAGPDRWFADDHVFDLAVRSRFLATHEAAARGELAAWENSAEGALALVLLFDQFPRNMFRGEARAFATDAAARAVAERALARGHDRATDSTVRPFFYLPFMHSERLADQDRCVRLYEALGDAEQLRYAREHREVIERFGRFPRRNHALGRETTRAEREFLDDTAD
jgi:uncharacterized protein (DUF924 family)/predicted enzyme related to lactoylglutathione lyase